MLPTIDKGDLVIFSGRFGSGKSEVSLNYARLLADQGGASESPILIDLDIVTPYFRTREMVAAMRAHGVEVIAPLELTETVDVPAITPQIMGAIEQTARPVVLDVGGDPQGARALGRYSQALERRGYVMHFVVNPYRPFTATPEAIKDSIREIETTSRLRASSLVSNPNLMIETTAALVLEGHAVVEAAARMLGLPVAFVVVLDSVLKNLGTDDLPVDLPVLGLDRHFALPWE